MRAVSLVLVFALLVVFASAVQLPDPVEVSVPYKWCGKAGDDATITSIVSNEFPPVKGDTLSLNVTGNLTKEVTDGTYVIAVSVGGFPLPDINGPISKFRSLPWSTGELNFTFSQLIPSAAPSGSYSVKISAVDQNNTQIFCITVAFQLKAADEHLTLRAISDKSDHLHNELLVAASKSEQLNVRAPSSPIQSIRRVDMKMPKMKPVHNNNRRV